MKIKDIPQVGKLGLTVTWSGRNGQIRRILVTPKDARTDKQLQVRGLLGTQARHFKALTDQQQTAWNVAAKTYRSHPSLGQSGPLTGLQMFVKVNSKLGLLGLNPVDAPPVAPEFPVLAVDSLAVTNTAGVIAVKLSCPKDPGDYTVLRASPPQGSGVRACENFRIIGICPTPAQGSADITALYVAEFGAVPVNSRIFVRASTMMSGFESLPREFNARVPAS